MRTSRIATALALALAGSAAPAAAQRWGTVEVGGFGHYTKFGDVLQLDNAPGLGGTLGFFVLPNLAVEADVPFARTDGPLSGDISYRNLHTRLAYHVPLTQQLKLALGAGYTLGIYGGDNTGNEYEDAAGALVGLKYYFKPSWALNVETLFDRFPSPANKQPRDTDGYWNNSLRAGVNWIYPPLERCIVTIEPATTSITQGDSRTFTATARGERSGNRCSGAVTFSSTDNAITPGGMYIARTPGQATITAEYRGRGQRSTASATVTVNRPALPPVAPPLPWVTTIDVRPDTATVLRGESLQLSVVRAAGSTD